MNKKEKKTEVITFRTTKTVKEWLEKEGEKLERTPAWMVDKIMKEYMEKEKSDKIQININKNEIININ